MSQSALAVMADRLQCDSAKLFETLKSTAFKGASNEELMALTVVCNQYKLNPFLKEIYAFPAKGGGIVPTVSIDGWLRIINDHPQMDGIHTEFTIENGKPVSCTCTIHRKDRKIPTVVTEYLAECRRPTDPWKMEFRMLRHKAIKECGRVAFGLGGIYDEDDADTLKQSVGREVPAARVPFIPETPAAPEQPQEPAAEAPPRRRRQAAPQTEAPPLTLSDEPETAVQRLTRKIGEDKLDPGKVAAWLDAAMVAPLVMIGEAEAATVLNEYDALKEAAQ